MVDEQRHLLDRRSKELRDLRHQFLAVEKRRKVRDAALAVADRIDADCEESARGETLEFLPMCVFVAVEAVIEQHNRP
jgi:hypothetical protein